MKNGLKIALAVALIGGVSATALGIDSASARGWGNDYPEQGRNWGGPHGRDGMMGSHSKWHGPRAPRGGMVGPDALRVLRDFDTDQDKALTKDELTKGLEKKITDNDKDGDGAVSLEEFKAEWMELTKDRMVRAYQRMDRDGNGKVTAEELKTPALFMFERMDRNEDGKLDKADREERRGFFKKRPDFKPMPPAPKDGPAPEKQ